MKRYKAIFVHDNQLNKEIDYGSYTPEEAAELALEDLGYEIVEYEDGELEFNYNDFHELKPGDQGYVAD